MSNTKQKSANRDPISGAPGTHPVGTGVGAATGGIAAGAAAGAAVGTVAGPIGTVAGAVAGAAVGAVAGGMAGKAIAEKVNPTAEHAYWRTNYATRSYVTAGASYDEYAPAYQYGWESHAKSQGKPFADVATGLERGWEKARGESKMVWNKAKDAARDGWEHVAHQDPSCCKATSRK
ncbi:MAG: glycine zipper domain-containing protein [Planctomycetota bacterium]|nr:glycine zipper domain-containing protein [Planctomycetota bacterium]